MQLQSLQNDIIQKHPLNFYIFTGEEVGIMDIYINKIAEVTDAEKIRSDSCLEVLHKVQKKRFSGGVRLFIIRDDKEFIKDEKLQQKLSQGWLPFDGTPYTDYVILIFTSLDERTKFFKSFKEDIVKFEKLNPELLEKYILTVLPGMSKKDCLTLANVCECDYSRLLLEADKIKQYSSHVNEANYGKSMNYLIEAGTIYQPIGDITFKFTDAILTRNISDTAEYLIQAKLKGEPEIRILSILYDGFKQILMVQGLGSDQSDACKRTGLTAWQVKMAKEKQGHYSIEELINAMTVVRNAEKGIKTGELDADIAIDYVIAKIM